MSSKPRAVLLGASNLARGLAAAVAAAGRVRPDRILIAGGRGRAYSRASALLVRGLPSILCCGLWRQLDGASEAGGETHALVTDLGNDLVYGASVAETMDAVCRVIERLRRAGARPVITPLPLSSLERFPTFWLDTVRRSFFPGSTLSAALLVDRAHRLDEALRRQVAERGLLLAEQQTDWYGLDPIHHRRARQADAFAAMTSAWGGQPRRAGLDIRRRLALAWPERSWLLGKPLKRAQPSAKLGDGQQVMLF